MYNKQTPRKRHEQRQRAETIKKNRRTMQSEEGVLLQNNSTRLRPQIGTEGDRRGKGEEGMGGEGEERRERMG